VIVFQKQHFKWVRHLATDKIMISIRPLLAITICIIAFGTDNINAQDIQYLPALKELQTDNSRQFPKYFVSQVNYAPQQDKVKNKPHNENLLTSKSLAKEDSSYFLESEHLNWKIRRSDLDYAISGDLNLGGGLDNAVRHEVKHSSNAGFRMLFGKTINNDWNIAFGLSSYDASQSASVNASQGLIYATLTNPYQFDTQIGRADAQSFFDQNIFDLYLSRKIIVGGKPNVKIFGSLRFADHGSNKRVNYFDIDEITPISNITTNTTSTGFGIRIGGEGIWYLNDTTFGFASGETSLLLNRVSATTVHTRHPGAGPDIVNSVVDSYTQPLTGLAASVGVGRKVGNLEFRMGYEMTAWFNLGVKTAITNDVTASYYSYDRKESDILLEGLFLRCTWDF
jgi:hypothetical protein